MVSETVGQSRCRALGPVNYAEGYRLGWVVSWGGWNQAHTMIEGAGDDGEQEAGGGVRCWGGDSSWVWLPVRTTYWMEATGRNGFCFLFFETKQLKGNKNVSNFLFIQKDKKKLVCKLVLWAQSTTKNYIRAKTDFSLSPTHSAHKSLKQILKKT